MFLKCHGFKLLPRVLYCIWYKTESNQIVASFGFVIQYLFFFFFLPFVIFNTYVYIHIQCKEQTGLLLRVSICGPLSCRSIQKNLHDDSPMLNPVTQGMPLVTRVGRYINTYFYTIRMYAYEYTYILYGILILEEQQTIRYISNRFAFSFSCIYTKNKQIYSNDKSLTAYQASRFGFSRKFSFIYSSFWV